MTAEQPSVEALVDRAKKAALRIRASVTVPATMEERAEAEAVIGSLTAALERAERERDEAEHAASNWRYLMTADDIETGHRLLAAEARAQKAEAVVEAARRYVTRDESATEVRALLDALTAYDEPPTVSGTVHWDEHGHMKPGPVPGAGQDGC